MKKTRLIIGGIFLIMASKSFAAKPTELQKTVALNAYKLQSDNNPAVVHKLGADPAVLVYNDTVYIYMTNDAQQAELTLGKQDNGYNRINTLNIFSSKDLVNWTDCGEIAVAGRSNKNGAAKWANNSWAPAICTKKIDGKDKFFLYFADSANGIGVLTADSPLGPFTDPLGHGLITRATPNTQGVYWLFDPAVLVDDDGTGYLYYGGGIQDDPAHPKSGRCVQLGDDMISIVGTPVEIDAPWLFEDSGINKIGNKYYYSYCSNWTDRNGATGPEVSPIAVIAYMTSDKPLGPFTYQGYTLKNPGTYFGAWGNNHHWIFEFKGKMYIAYHAQTVEKQLKFEKGGYRSLYITDFKVNEDGSLPIQDAKTTGVAQVGNFNAFETVPAATMHSSRNVAVTNDQTVVPVKDGGYICIKGAKLNGGKKLVITANGGAKDGTLKICKDHFANGTVLGEAKIPAGAEKSTIETALTIPADVDSADIFLVFTGDYELLNWFIK